MCLQESYRLRQPRDRCGRTTINKRICEYRKLFLETLRDGLPRQIGVLVRDTRAPRPTFPVLSCREEVADSWLLPTFTNLCMGSKEWRIHPVETSYNICYRVSRCIILTLSQWVFPLGQPLHGHNRRKRMDRVKGGEKSHVGPQWRVYFINISTKWSFSRILPGVGC